MVAVASLAAVENRGLKSVAAIATAATDLNMS